MAAKTLLIEKSEEEWKAILSPQHFHILREKGTEPHGTGHYDKFYDEGVYKVQDVQHPSTNPRPNSTPSCGWPAFYEGFPGAINRSPDPDGRRTEITCAACGGHLGACL